MIVRQLEHEYLGDVEDLLALMHKEIGHFPLSHERMRRTIGHIMSGGVVLGLYENEDESALLGSIGLYYFRPWYSETLVMGDKWVFIHPEHRTFKAFNTLIKSAMDTANLNSRPLIIQLHSVKDNDRKEILFKRYMDKISHVYNIDATQAGGAFLHKG